MMQVERIDERDVTVEWDLRSYRLIDWAEYDPSSGDRNNSVAENVRECALDEFIEYALRRRNAPIRLTELFAILSPVTGKLARVPLGTVEWAPDGAPTMSWEPVGVQGPVSEQTSTLDL